MKPYFKYPCRTFQEGLEKRLIKIYFFLSYLLCNEDKVVADTSPKPTEMEAPLLLNPLQRGQLNITASFFIVSFIFICRIALPHPTRLLL